MHTHMRGAWRALAVGGAAIICGCRSGGSSAPPQTNSAPVPPVSTASAASTVASPAVQRFDGYAITMKITMGVDTAPASITMKVAGDQVRMDMGDLIHVMSRREGAPQGMSEAMSMMSGAFALMQSGGKMTVVMPGMNMGMTMDMGTMLSGGPDGMMEIKDAQMTVDDLGTGERVLGHATRKYRIRQKFTMVMNIMGQSRTEAIDQTLEVWAATGLGDAETALRAFEKAFTSMSGGAVAAMKEFEAKRPPGIGLKTIMTQTKADSTKSTSTMEFTEFKKASFDAAEFTVPAGIQIMDMGAMMSGRGRGGN